MRKPEIKNLKKAAVRILSAVKSKENIIIYSDSDLDGVASAIILKESLKTLGGEVAEVYFPDREKEGYGLTGEALDYLKKYLPALLVTLDCGIGNFKEMKIAKNLGFETIIVDHHEILDKLPEASIIVDPKQKGDRYGFKYFAAAGLAFKLAQSLFGDKMPDGLEKNFLELAALATVADMMPRIDENETMIADGLNYLKSTWRPGLQALFSLPEIKNLNLMEKVYKVNSLLNIRDIKNRMPFAFRLLTSRTKNEAEKLAENLFKRGLERKEKIAEMVEEVKRRFSKNPSEPVIFEGDSYWEVALLGVAASILSKECQKPVFLYKKGKKDSQMGARAPSDFNLVEAMKGFSKNLMTFGGHPQAAGCRAYNEKLEEFKKHLSDYFGRG